MGNICKVSLCSVTSKYEISVGAVSRSWQGRAMLTWKLATRYKTSTRDYQREMEQQQQCQTSLTEYDLILMFPTVKVLPMCPGPGPPSYKLLILTSDQLKVMIQLILTKGNIITTHKIDTLKIVYHRLGGRLCPNQKYKISHTSSLSSTTICTFAVNVNYKV